MPIHALIESNARATSPRSYAPEIINVASYLVEMAHACPDQRAIVQRDKKSGRFLSWTFRELNENCDRYANALASIGLRRGMRTILMVRPNVEFFALTFALYKIGAVPVLVDPGMGRRRMAQCLAAIDAEAFIGIPLAHFFRAFHASSFRNIHIRVSIGNLRIPGAESLSALAKVTAKTPFEVAKTFPNDPAAIIFTTGSTGPPKAVLYRHEMFDAQIRILRDHFHIASGEIDLPTFPLFALFDPALGMTAVLPEMNPTRPAEVDPRKIITAIREQRVTHMFGSPALLDRVSRFGIQHSIKLETLRRVISAGAPVQPAVLERLSRMLSDDAEIHTPYGATEALPVASISSREILAQTAELSRLGHGTCVGRAVSPVSIQTIRIEDGPIDSWTHDLLVPVGEVGEIVVSGPVVTREYLTDGGHDATEKHGEMATRLAKIFEGEKLWHRMGDLGYFDESRRLWFCGRKAHRVETGTKTLFTDPIEGILNTHPAIRRSALVGIGPRHHQTPVVCIELEEAHRWCNKAQLARDLRTLAARHDVTRGIEHFLFHRRFPVDIRHNAKIFREKLAVWAAGKLKQPLKD